MKNSMKLFLVLFFGLTIIACGNNKQDANAGGNSTEDTEMTDHQMDNQNPEEIHAKVDTTMPSSEMGKEYTSAYVCPMHCKGSGSDQPGQCPVCGMDYVQNTEHNADGQMQHHEDHKH